MQNLGEILKKINIKSPILYDEPMSSHTSFKIGGPAEVLIIPEDTLELSRVFSLLLENNIPYFVLGSGSNILVSDKGIKGAILDLYKLKGCLQENDRKGSLLTAMAGTDVTEVCEKALELGLSGMEFLYSMPGSIGGSIWMNAHCYGSSISDILHSVEILDERGSIVRLKARQQDFGYKSSPFQKRKLIILKGSFRLHKGKKKEIRKKMFNYKKDRELKGHFLFPCAGSTFKNNRDFGSPTGRIIDSLGLKGYRIGDAKVSDLHANIIINAGNARASEVLELIQFIEDKVRRSFGFNLEREILLIGEL